MPRGRKRKILREDPFIDDELVKSIEIGAPVLPTVRIEDPFQDDGSIPTSTKHRKTNCKGKKFVGNISIPEPFSEASSSIPNEASSSTLSEHVEVMDECEINEPFFDHGVLDDFSIVDDNSEQLYESCKITVNQALAILFTWFCSYPGISKEAFGRLLFLLHGFFLPPVNKLPQSYSKARSAIGHLIVPVEEFDCCVNDCVLFRNCSSEDLSTASDCPKCGEDRYEPYTSVARKKYKYIPLAPRLKRMFANQKISKLLQDHQSEVAADKHVIVDLHQSRAWKDRYAPNGSFRGDVRGISLALCTDGTNPFSKEKVSYSMWPIVLTILNLPPSCRTSSGSLLLAGIIPGKSEPHNLDPYIDVLVDEIIALNGSQCYDGFRNERFELSVDILMHVVDYPGHSKLFHCLGAGAYAGCAYCVHKGEHSKVLQKIIYPGNRCFLLKNDSLRHDITNFPSKKKNFTDPPKLKTTKYVDDANAKYVAAGSDHARKMLQQTTGCKGSYALRRLPFHERVISTPVDPMHLIKNIVSHCVNLVAGREDSHKVREEEKLRGRFPASWIKDGSQKKLPPAPFCLSNNDIALADERAKRVFVPTGFDWHAKEIFKTTTGMKSHEWRSPQMAY